MIRLSSIFSMPVLMSYLTREILEKSLLVQSSAVLTDDNTNALATSTSVKATIPFWNPVSVITEPFYGNDNPADVAVPTGVGAGSMDMRLALLNEGFSAAQMVTEIQKQSPLQEIAGKIDGYWANQFQKRVLATAMGVYNDSKTNHSSDMIVDVSKNTPTATSVFSAGALLDADETMGDTLDGLGIIICHRHVYTQMQKNNLIAFVEDSISKVMIPYYMGKIVLVDNGVPHWGTGANRRYMTLTLGTGAFKGALINAINHEAYQANEEEGNGAGTETLWTRRNMIVHPHGYSFTSAKITGNQMENPAISASWKDLADVTNWNRQLSREDVRMSFLVTN